MTQDQAKALVGRRAAEFVRDGMNVGLGTGTTARYFIRALADRVTAGLNIRCVASSDASHTLGESLGLSMTTLVELPVLDVYIDGADEIGPSLALIKGGGGALLREKIVASAAREFIVVADSTKVVAELGAFPLPVETIQLATPLVQRRLEEMRLQPALRKNESGSAYITDEGNHILDCACGRITEPVQLAEQIRHIVGVVEHGLFLGMARLALIAGEGGVEEQRP